MLWQAVFNVAGAASWKDLDDVDTEELLGLFTTNAVGPLLVVQRLVRAGLLGQGSLIVNMTSKVCCPILGLDAPKEGHADAKILAVELP